ncbi:hypothetical protein J6590_091979 [Homalodisca vitripennis]|nr:hypothetical protein J6590_032478 [Homalodisca vitripennis]KAG8314494.1 hypothetical protein J6590_091979 [Homalodisca vitripennis]
MVCRGNLSLSRRNNTAPHSGMLKSPTDICNWHTSSAATESIQLSDTIAFSLSWIFDKPTRAMSCSDCLRWDFRAHIVTCGTSALKSILTAT